MLDFLGETSCADKISRAVDDVAQLIASMAQKPGTKEITAMVEERME